MASMVDMKQRHTTQLRVQPSESSYRSGSSEEGVSVMKIIADSVIL